MSMYANKEDLYKAKCDYYEKKFEEVLLLLDSCHADAVSAKDWNLVDRINSVSSEIEESL